MPFRSERLLKASMPGRAGYPENEPRPLANLSHNALNLLEHGFYSDHEHIMAEMGQPFKFERKSGKPIWSAHNLGLGKEENAHPELYHHMIINELEGEPVNFQEIMQERNIRESENTPWELNEPQTFNFSGTESIPSKYTTFSTSTGYGPNMFSEIMEGRRSGGFQDIHTGEPMDLSWRLLKEMYHGTQASPQSLMEYGIQPPAEVPTMAMTWEQPSKRYPRGRPAGRNMAMFEQWYRLQDASPEEREEKMNALQELNNRVYLSPERGVANLYANPSSTNMRSYGNTLAPGLQGQVATIDDSNLDLTAGRQGADVEVYNQGAIPPSLIQGIEPVQTGEPMELSWRLLKTSNYRQAAGAIIRDSEGRVLLMRRSPLETSMHGMYELPGGKLEEGETPEDAARIEALEESGLPIVNLQALNPHVDHGMEKIYHGFTADIDPQHEGEVVRSDEHDNHMWIHPQEALNMQGHPDGMDVPFLSHHAANLFEQMVG